MKASKYLDAISHASKVEADSYQLYGDAILVEKVPPEEIKRKSGIILDTGTDMRQIGSISADKPMFVHVLSIGKGYYNEETGEDVPLSVQPGDIILVGVNSVKWFSHFEVENYDPYSIGLSRESEIQIKFKGLEGYKRYFDAINSKLKGTE